MLRGEGDSQDRRGAAVLPAAVECKVQAFAERLQHVPGRLCHGGHPCRRGCTLGIFNADKRLRGRQDQCRPVPKNSTFSNRMLPGCLREVLCRHVVTRAARRGHAILYFKDSPHETGAANFQSLVLKRRCFQSLPVTRALPLCFWHQICLYLVGDRPAGFDNSQLCDWPVECSSAEPTVKKQNDDS